ncbi:MAG: EAL domain-containing protein [Lachnospiraceae bacterium]|nr:EAL domain-containing protein [Lachnospiraceae bacterium]
MADKYELPLVTDIRRTVLIVDDQKINRKLLESILEDEYTVLYAEDGEEAIRVIGDVRGGLSAILLDLVMPKIDGFGVLMRIREEDDLKEIPVIVLTQQEDEETELRALAAGAMDFISKPYNPKIIRYRLSNMIRLRESSEIIYKAERDPLTGLYTRDFFVMYVNQIISLDPMIDADFITVDIDNFKLMNDLYGHTRANDLLTAISETILKEITKKKGIACRTGADVFSIFVPHRDDAKEFLDGIFGPLALREDIPQFKLRYGIYVHADLKMPVATLIDRSSMAADEARGQYNNNCVYYDDKMRMKLLYDQMLIDGLREALEKHQFQVFLQPKYSVVGRRLYGAEALVRWKHPKMGFISPALFIPLYEKNGLIYVLDRYVWEETCRILRKWKDKYKKEFPISVNLSRVDVYDPRLPEFLDELVKKYEISKNNLHLEITESAYTRDPEQLISIVNMLRGKGFVIEMDDFGSGYSSLNMLTQMPIDILKLDMNLLQQENATKENPGLMKYIMEIAKWMQVPVVAEGVETEEQLEMLADLECEYAQGYYFSKPVSELDFEQYFLENKV